MLICPQIPPKCKGILMESYLFRRLQAPVTMERLNEKDATAFSAVFNHFHVKFFISPIQVLCFSFFFELIIAQTIFDYKYLRACLESPRVRMAQSDFSSDDAKTAGNTLCINEDFGKIWRKRCKPDVRGEILNRLLA